MESPASGSSPIPADVIDAVLEAAVRPRGEQGDGPINYSDADEGDLDVAVNLELADR